MNRADYSILGGLIMVLLYAVGFFISDLKSCQNNNDYAKEVKIHFRSVSNEK
jgi:hypothetical protein